MGCHPSEYRVGFSQGIGLVVICHGIWLGHCLSVACSGSLKRSFPESEVEGKKLHYFEMLAFLAMLPVQL